MGNSRWSRTKVGVAAALVGAAVAAIVASSTNDGEIVTVTAGAGAQTVLHGVVARDVDGDTIHVTVNGKDVTVRLLGVDTPETHKPNFPVECYGPEASAFTKSYATGRVTLTTEPSSGDVTDRYGRTLAYVYVVAHRQDLGAQLLRRGYARVYAYGNRRFARRTRYETYETRAKAKHVGVWQCPHPFIP
jgi:micrococcal nuclease